MAETTVRVHDRREVVGCQGDKNKSSRCVIGTLQFTFEWILGNEVAAGGP